LVPRSSLAIRSRLSYVLAGVIALVLIGVVGFVVTSRGCGLFSGRMATGTGECVGVIDKSDELDPSVSATAGRILDEDAQVTARPGPYVKVALLTPLSVSANTASAMSLDQVHYSLEGAYTALFRINHGDDFGDPAAVRIDLVLVNEGSEQDYSDQLRDAILALSEPNHPLVAVVGMGSSFVGTEQMARALSARGIPMVTAVASADSLDARQIPGLHSVSPANTDYVLALKELLDQHRPTLPLTSAIVVGDVNDDPYVQTLNQVYSQTLADYVKFSRLPFRGGTVGHPATPDVFDPVVTNLCNAVNDSDRLNTVLFAGRVADFRAFADVLAIRTCRSTPLAILVGATGFGAAQQYVSLLDQANVTVIYASSADSPTWLGGGPGTPEGFAAFAQQFQQLGFPVAALDDGYAIMYHDALASAARAVRLAAQGTQVPGPADLEVQFGNVIRAYTVRGASGTLSFGVRPDGRASGKLVVYRQLGTGTPIRLPAGLPAHFM
jgi:hypothetical protein